MGHFTPCVYCLEIPPLDQARKGDMHRCPLCKTEILETAGGASYRLRNEEGDEIHPPPARKKGLLALFGLGAGASALLLGWLLHAFHADTVQPEPRTVMQRAVPAVETPIDVPATVVAVQPVPSTVAPSRPQLAKGEFKDRGLPAPWPRSKDGDPELASDAKTETGIVAKVVAALPACKLKSVPAGRYDFLSQIALQAVLESTSELELEKIHKDERKQARDKIATLVMSIQRHNKDKIDGFVKHLQKERTDLAGLPFRMSPDCQLDKSKGEYLRASATVVRELLSTAEAAAKRHSYSEGDIPKRKAEQFWSAWGHARKKYTSPSVREAEEILESVHRALPALEQILQTEEQGYRIGLVKHLAGIKDPEASRALVQRVLYDPSPEVRGSALALLHDRPQQEYSKLLLEGLRYPLVPVKHRAAAALAFLHCQEQVPQLVALLDAADPDAPFTTTMDNKQVTKVRELVRVNHHKNCLLCHAPSTNRQDLVRAVVPDPSRELPSSGSIAYYAERNGISVVRADVTYLRQDFSMLLPVANPEPWPTMQRFDFFVRERVLDKDEVARLGKPQRNKDAGPTPYQIAVLHALRELTSMDAGASAAEWRAALAVPVRRWHGPCLK